MLNSDSRLDLFASDVLIKIRQQKSRQEQLQVIKQLMFNLPVLQKVVFPHELSPREIECLYFAAFGDTIEETAQKINIKPSTVIAHRKSMIRKMDCRNITQAVFKGFCYGLLSLNENMCSSFMKRKIYYDRLPKSLEIERQ